MKADVASSLPRRTSRDPISDSPAPLFANNPTSSDRLSALPAMPQGYYNLPMARIDPNNRTGTGGEDLLSQNFNWSLPLVGLSGRGLDLGLTLSYNSLVWTRSGNYIDFDTDEGSIAPGFRLGFPTVEGPDYNDQAGTYFYLMVTPSGARVELRRIGTSTTYESADSAHLQLVDYGSSLLVRSTDGTQLNFITVNSTWRCNQIKDRNGNYLTVSYNSYADITTITDTLGRVVTFNYDGYANLISITQAWNGQAHYWATFGYGSVYIGSNFPGLTSYGPDGSYVTVLTQVGLPDGSRYNFEYNSSYGMVSTIRHYAYDGDQQRYTSYLYSASGSDCPRISERHDWAENWTGLNGVPAEVVTQYNLPGDGSHQMIAPDGTVYREYYGTGWQKGLTTQSEVWSGGVRQKWTTTAWTQDNTSVNYQTNPRVTETNIYDAAGNRGRATIDYNSVAVGATTCHLPETVRQYGGINGDQLLRRIVTLYSWDQALLDRRVIGLMSRREVYEGESTLVSMVAYIYDWVAGYMDGTAPAVQHDTANYGPSLGAGRGILVAAFRYNVNDTSQGIWAQTFGYNLAGETVWMADGVGHRTNISYADSFSDGNNGRGTLAYPTTVTDPDGFSSTAQYNYDFGARTQVQGPPPAGQSQGIIQTFAYDNAARIQQVTTTNNGAYTRYVYGPNYTQSFSSVNNVADDAYSIQYLDGAGRTILAGGNHPGSSGGYRGIWTQYNIMGHVMRQSNPTEITAGWLTSGDDAAGWLFTAYDYDWKGRPLVTTNTDGTQKYASYGGCGCAGGEVVTLTDEMGRQQRVTSDVLGRTWKTEVLNWDGSVYSTTENTLNARDQVTLVRQFQGTDTSGVYQDTVMTYDGHGRLQSKHLPEQNSGAATTYSYNNDDTVNSVTDARGASATYSYNNNRHLVSGITYSAPSGVVTTPDASFSYDPAGNRTSASSGTGSSTYGYDQLSRLISETYQFSDLSGSYALNYGYNLGGELTSLSIPFTSQSIGYNYDSAGRLSSVSAGGFSVNSQPVTSFISSIAYRAWGARKSTTYGNTVSEALSYNARLQPTSYTLGNVNYTNTNVWPNQSFSSMGWTYDYYDDGRVNHAYDSTWNFWDRSYAYDHAGRLQEADTNRVAHGLSWDYWHPDPYKQTWTYDVWNNLKRAGYLYNDPLSDSSAYTNNRRSDSAYDANGNVTANLSYQNTFDVFGSNTHATSVQQVGDGSTQWPQQPAIDITETYEANGHPCKRTQIMRQNDYDLDTGEFTGVSEDTLTSHYLYSSVLGARVVEIDGYGQVNTWIYAGGQRIAAAVAGTYANTTFEHDNPVTGSWVTTNGHSASRAAARQERDPLNAQLPLTNPGGATYAAQNWNQPLFIEGGDPSDLSGGCQLDGLATACSNVEHGLDTGAVVGELSVGGKGIGFWDFTGHGQLGLDYLSGKYGSIRIGVWHEEPGKMGDTNTYAASGNVKDDDGNPITDVLYGNSSGYYTYTFVNASFGPQNSDKHHQTFTLEQRLTANIAGNIAITPLIERPECRKYVTGRKMTAKQAVKLFLNVVNSMTYDPQLLDFAETDEDFGRVRLGYTFFNPSEASPSLLDLLEQTGGVKDTSALMTAVSQQAYIELHEFKHKATRKKHVGAKELGEWYKGLYDNCFKEK
jgi:YD repeat-containing protein